MNKRLFVCSCIPALIFAGIMAVYVDSDIKNISTSNLFVLMLCAFTVLFPVVYACMCIMNRIAEKTKKEYFANQYGMLHYCMMLLMMWTPWMIMCFPGNIAWDTGTSILYGLGLDRSNVNNPIIQNHLFTFVYRFGVMIRNIDFAVFIYLVLQTLVYAFVFAYSIRQTEKWGAPVWLVRGLLWLYGLSPVVPLYAFTMGKDSNFAIMLYAFSFFLLKLMVEKEQFLGNRKKVLCLFFSGVAVGLLRNIGWVISMTALSIVAFQAIRTNWNKKNVLVASLLSLILADCLVSVILQPPKGNISENLSIPIQQTAYYFKCYGDEVAKEEYAAVAAVMDMDTIKDYNPELSDPVKDCFSEYPSKEELFGYFRVWWKQFQKHPKAYAIAFYNQSYRYYTPCETSLIKPDRMWGYNISKQVFQQTELKRPEKTLIGLAKATDTMIQRMPIIGLLQQIGIYTWTFIIAITYLIYRRKYKWIVSWVPLMFVFLGCICSPVNGYVRYALPMIISVPLLCSLSVVCPEPT